MQFTSGRPLQLAACLSILAATSYSQAPPSLNVGFYDWGGTSTKSISEGVDEIAQIGGHIARLTISARMNVDYGISSSCISNFTLAQAVQYPDVMKALDNPAISVFILTAYDGVTFPDCVNHLYLEPTIYTPEREAEIIREYSDLTVYLYQAYQHTNKRFIISNWESDNDVYCGYSFGYATDPSFRASCDAGYPQMYGGNANAAASFEGLKHWFRLRQRGIDRGRERAMAAGIGGMKVYFAPEFCAVRSLHDAGLESTLYDVVPYVKFDYVSYSSYQSTSMKDPGSALLQDLRTIQNIAGSNAIIIGEIMTASPGADPQTFIQTLHTALDDAITWGVPYLIYWSLHSALECPICGVFDISGNLTQVGAFFEEYLTGADICSVEPARWSARRH